MRAEQLKCGVDAIPITSESDVDDRQIGRGLGGEFNRFFARWRKADNIKSGFGQRSFDLRCNQQIVLDNQDTGRFAGPYR